MADSDKLELSVNDDRVVNIERGADKLAELLGEALVISDERKVWLIDGETVSVALWVRETEEGHAPVELSQEPPEKLVGNPLVEQRNVWFLSSTSGKRGGGSGKGPQRKLKLRSANVKL